MYQNAHIKKLKRGFEIHIWDDHTGYKKFNFKNYAYIKHPGGTYVSLYGDKLKRVTYWTEDDLKNGKVFESDVPIETRVLVDKYGSNNNVSEGHREMIFDIEVDSTNGFPDVSLAENEIIL